MVKIEVERNKGFYSENFLENCIPNLFKNLLLSKIKEVKYLSVKNYLLKEEKISLNELIEVIPQQVVIKKYPTKFILEVDNNTYLKRKKVENLVNLVDMGNMSLRGTDLFNSTFRDIEDNLNSFFFLYLSNKGGKIWQ